MSSPRPLQAQRSGGSARGAGVSLDRLARRGVVLVVGLFLLVLIGAPVGGTLFGSLWSQSPFQPGGYLTLLNWLGALSPGFTRSFWTSFVLASVVAPACVVLGGVFALFVTRTDVGGKRLLDLSLYLNLMLSPFVLAAAWVALASPRSGLLNYLPARLFQQSLFDIYTLSGLAFVMVTFLTPWLYAMVKPAFARADHRLEEAAAISGARPAAVFRDVTVPVLRPVILGSGVFIFAMAMEMFSIPALLGAPVGITVLSYEIYRNIQVYPPNWPASATIATMMLVITGLLLALQRRLTGDFRRYQVLGAPNQPVRQLRLGRLRGAATTACIVYVVIATWLPAAALVLQAFSRYAAGQDVSLQTFTTSNFTDIFSAPRFARVPGNTLIAMLVGAAGATLLCFLTAVIVYWLRPKGATAAFDAAIRSPIALPGIVLGAGLLWFYFRIPFPIYGSLAIVVIAVGTKYLPQVFNLVAGSYVQIPGALRDAALVSGARLWDVVRDVDFPLLRTALIAGFVFDLILISGEVNATVMVYSRDSVTMPILLWQILSGDQATQTAYALAILQFALTAVLLGAAAALGAGWQRIQSSIGLGDRSQ